MGDGIDTCSIRIKCLQDLAWVYCDVCDKHRDLVHCDLKFSHGTGSLKALTGIVAETQGRLAESLESDIIRIKEHPEKNESVER